MKKPQSRWVERVKCSIVGFGIGSACGFCILGTLGILRVTVGRDYKNKYLVKLVKAMTISADMLLTGYPPTEEERMISYGRIARWEAELQEQNAKVKKEETEESKEK